MSCATCQNGTIVPTHERDLVGTMVFEFIRAKYGPLRHAAKILARDANILSSETARKWLSGRSTPGGDSLLWLCVRNRELQTQMHEACDKLRAAKGL